MKRTEANFTMFDLRLQNMWGQRLWFRVAESKQTARVVSFLLTVELKYIWKNLKILQLFMGILTSLQRLHNTKLESN